MEAEELGPSAPMRKSEITYKNVDRLLAVAVPELAPVLERQQAHSGGDDPAQHTIFGPLLSAIGRMVDSEASDDVLRRTFGFFELTADSQDLEVLNLLDVAVVEYLLSHPAQLAKVWRFMGRATRKQTRWMARKLKCTAIVPSRWAD